MLQRLDPGSFVDALAELARGDHGTAKREAILLLGAGNHEVRGSVEAEQIVGNSGHNMLAGV